MTVFDSLTRRQVLAIGVSGASGGLAACITRSRPTIPVVIQNKDDNQHRIAVTVSSLDGTNDLFETQTVIQPGGVTRFPTAIRGSDHPIDVEVTVTLDDGPSQTRQFRPLRDVLTIEIATDGFLFISTSVIETHAPHGETTNKVSYRRFLDPSR